MGMIWQTLGGISGILSVALPFLFVLTVVVFIHELGHFLVARWCGVKVQAFSIGFGREIYGFYDKHGTRWKLSWIPLGGYVRFMDDENAASAPSKEIFERMTPEERAMSFQGKSLAQKSAIVAAGPIANFLLSIVLFAGIFTFAGVLITVPRIDEVVEGSPAAQGGFKAGDLIVAIDGKPIESFSDMQRIASSSADTELTFTVERSGQFVTLKATPKLSEVPDGFGGKLRVGLLGIKRAAVPNDWKFKKYGPIDSVVLAFKESYFVAARNLAYMRDVITRKESADQLGGPIRIADVSGKVASAGLVPLLHLTAVISVSIGLLNLFPIPLLDGGHLLFYGVEAIRRKPLSDRAQEVGVKIGIAFVLMLMVFATWNDLGIVKRWLGGVG
jgi:regulator of sigma E protease